MYNLQSVVFFMAPKLLCTVLLCTVNIFSWPALCSFQPWWTPITSYESPKQQAERTREFVNHSRYCAADVPIYVGHSLFFKGFYSQRISEVLRANRPELSECMRRHRLTNGTLLAVTVKYREESFNLVTGACDGIIIDADVVFGGGFTHVKNPQEEGEAEEHNDREEGDGDYDDDDEDEEIGVNGMSLMARAGFSRKKSAAAERDHKKKQGLKDLLAANYQRDLQKGQSALQGINSQVKSMAGNIFKKAFNK